MWSRLALNDYVTSNLWRSSCFSFRRVILPFPSFCPSVLPWCWGIEPRLFILSSARSHLWRSRFVLSPGAQRVLETSRLLHFTLVDMALRKHKLRDRIIPGRNKVMWQDEMGNECSLFWWGVGEPLQAGTAAETRSVLRKLLREKTGGQNKV